MHCIELDLCFFFFFLDQVGDKGDYCTALNCAGGVSGTCNRYNGDWSGNTVECGAETTSSFLQTMEATADANPDATCRCVDKCVRIKESNPCCQRRIFCFEYIVLNSVY